MSGLYRSICFRGQEASLRDKANWDYMILIIFGQETDRKLSVKCMCHLLNKLELASIHVSINIPP